MKILFFTTAPFNMGGPGKWFIDLKSELEKKGHEINVVTWGDPKILIYNLENIKIVSDKQFINFFGFRSFNFLNSIIKAALLIKKEFKYKFDIIQTGGIFESFGTAFVDWKIPTITTLHGDYYTELSPFLEKTPYPRIFRFIYYILEKIAISRTSIFTVPSKWLKEKLKKRINSKRVIIIPNAINLPNLNNFKEIKIKLNIPKNKIVFVILTNFNNEHRYLALKMLINGIKKMKNQNKIILLVIGGKRPTVKEDWDKKVKEIANSLPIWFLGYKKEIFDIIYTADAILHPSFLDNHPISILEAMGCGKPVFASNIGGIPEIIDNEYNGILLENSPEIWAKLLDKAVDGEINLKEMGENARKKIEKNFSWNIIINKYEEIYKSLNKI